MHLDCFKRVVNFYAKLQINIHLISQFLHDLSQKNHKYSCGTSVKYKKNDLCYR